MNLSRNYLWVVIIVSLTNFMGSVKAAFLGSGVASGRDRRVQLGTRRLLEHSRNFET